MPDPQYLPAFCLKPAVLQNQPPVSPQILASIARRDPPESSSCRVAFWFRLVFMLYFPIECHCDLRETLLLSPSFFPQPLMKSGTCAQEKQWDGGATSARTVLPTVLWSLVPRWVRVDPCTVHSASARTSARRKNNSFTSHLFYQTCLSVLLV